MWITLQPRPNENAGGQKSKNETCTICLFYSQWGTGQMAENSS